MHSDKGEQSIYVLLDLSAAFDTVDNATYQHTMKLGWDHRFFSLIVFFFFFFHTYQTDILEFILINVCSNLHRSFVECLGFKPYTNSVYLFIFICYPWVTQLMVLMGSLTTALQDETQLYFSVKPNNQSSLLCLVNVSLIGFILISFISISVKLGFQCSTQTVSLRN